MLGQVESVEEVLNGLGSTGEAWHSETALSRTKTWWDDLLGTIEVHTPELAVDFLINRWLLYQSLSCRIWGRSALLPVQRCIRLPRSNVQDVMAFLYASPALVRRHHPARGEPSVQGRRCAALWHSTERGGVDLESPMTRCGLPYVVAQYLRSPRCDLLHTEFPSSTGLHWKAISTKCSSHRDRA